MEIISKNPFRIAGLFANSTERELQKNKAKIRAYSKVGKEITFDTDFPFLPRVDRNEHTLNIAFSKLQQNQDKIHYGLFWFLNLSPIDKTAIEYLKKGYFQKAKEIWTKLTNGKDVNSKNFSAFNNLGTLLFLNSTTEELQQGLQLKIKLINSENFQEFVHNVADKTFTFNNNELLDKFVDEIINQLEHSMKLSKNQLIALFNNFNPNIKTIIHKKFTETPINNIETLIEITKKRRKENKANSYEFGIELYDKTKGDIKLLKSLLGSNDVKYKFIADNLAKEILQCGIDYFKENEDKLSWEEGDRILLLFEKAEKLAISNHIKERINDNIEGLSEWLDNYDEIRLSHLCWFCEKNKPDEKCKFTINMYLEISRSYNKVHYKKLEVPVNRCCECKKYHIRANNRALKISTFVYIIMFLISISYIGSSEDFAVYIVLALLLIVPIVIINNIISNIIISKKYKIKSDTRGGVKDYPLIKEFLKQGWTFSEPSA